MQKLLVVLSLCVVQQGWGQAVVPGISFHTPLYPSPQEAAALMAKAGFKVGRTDMGWNNTEAKQGQYDWSHFEPTFAALRAEGIRPIIILDYQNPIYNPPDDPKASPATEETRKAYARWAAAAAKYFAPYDPIWEIWNEPNIGFWKPKPNAADYTKLAEEACLAIRKEVPNATISGPALSGIPGSPKDARGQFLKTVMSSRKLMECLNTITVHPYLKEPEELSKRLPLLSTLASPTVAKEMPSVAVSEWGYSTYAKGFFSRNMSETEQAARLVRMQLVGAINHLPYTVIYDWRDDGKDIFNIEHNFGLLSADGHPKAAYEAIRTLTRQLEGYTFEKMEQEKEGAYAAFFKNMAGNRMLVAWQTEGSSSMTWKISADATKLQQIDMLGDTSSIEVSAGSFTINLSSSPVYIDLKDLEATKAPPES